MTVYKINSVIGFALFALADPHGAPGFELSLLSLEKKNKLG
jgi:hypothetical protein